MAVQRRQVLRILGGGSVIAVAAAGGFVATRTPREALAPWASAGIGYDDPRLATLSWAILAPNPHNRQPWLVRLDGDNAFTLFAEQDRKLPHTDPFDRQITIGLGCFLELARIAASSLGFALDIDPFPDGEAFPVLDSRPVAHVRLRANAMTADPLFAAVPTRRSCKEPFDRQPPADAQLDRLTALSNEDVRVACSVNPDRVNALRDIGWRSHLIESQTARTHGESVDLMRIGRAEIESNPDGISLGGPLMDSLKLLGLMTREQLADSSSSVYQQGLAMYRRIHEETPAFTWLSTATNTRRDQLAAGAAWLRLNLTTTQLGLALHPISQSLQEYAEMAELLEAVHEQLGAAEGERVQMLGRLGYGPEPSPSPRWPLQARITTITQV